MNHELGLSRRGVLRAGLGGIGVAALSLPSGQAVASRPHDGPLSATATRALEFSAGTNASVIVSPDGRQLIMEVQGVLWSLPREGGRATALTHPDLEPTRLSWSPDGSQVAVCGYQGGGFHVWTMEPDGSRLRQLTSGPWDDRGVAWSPDGTRIAFASERGGSPVAGSSYTIWTVDVRTGELRQLTDGAGVEDYDPSWYPDGSGLVFVRAGAAGGRTLASVPAEGGSVTVVRTVATGVLIGPAVSADGRVACVHVGDAVRPANATGSRLLVDGEAVTEGEDVSPLPPSWGTDGALFYVADGQLRVRRPAQTGGRSVPEQIPFRAALDVPRVRYPGKEHEFDSTVARPVRGIHLPVLSPDGGSVAFAALNALWVMPIGRRPRKLVQSSASGYVQMPSWAPDGRSVVYSYEGGSDGNGLIDVHRYWLDDDRDEVVATGGRLNAALSPDGVRLACQDYVGNLLVKDLSAGTEKILATPLGANGLPSRPTWSADGRYIAFCDRNRLNRRFREGYNLIRVVDTSTGEWTAHQPEPHSSLADRGNAGPVWAPDGSAMAFIMESALWILPVHADGTPAGDPQRLTDEAADHPSWSGDSRTLLYEASGKLKIINRDGTGPRVVPVPLDYSRRLPSPAGITRVHAGRLWDGTGDTVRENVDIVIRGNRITAVEPHRTGVSSGEKLVDASTSTVIPGLWDSHTHPWQYTYGGRQGSLMLAYGITTNVSLGGFAHEAVRIRESVQAGRMAGPRLFATGELIDGSRVAYSMGRAHGTQDGLRRSLERAEALDYDFVKTYVRASARTMREAVRTAHEKLGVLSGSHLLSPGVSVGQDLTTHLEATQRSEYGRAHSPTGRSYQDVVETYRDGDFKLIITPFTALSLLGADPSVAGDPRVTTLMPPWDTALVDKYAATPLTPAANQAVAEEMAVYRRIIAEGGMLVLGTDAPLTPVGLHLHICLRALHACGLSPAEALRTATAVPAQLFGVADDLGTVEPGKLADLTAVDGNPFDDFDDLIRTTWAMREGTLYQQDDLVEAFTRSAPRHSTAHPTDWLDVSRQFRREPCCSRHVFDS
ncbi:PD40 domain-containing protein [Streptomyces actinomycinicus]|uniref:PD40 domain-containing protein n=1 Tax=Streptomyces actinomycinicus TaxID=1695166 RepID=A0A937JRM1_9ACTN|nr:amidohydrolase family protein [Streptomyces actinomycinicus]MBL1086576.1 PD40 domain-containing protein [Streptomyces actinomycinicus]